jgi:hypothetical protein
MCYITYTKQRFDAAPGERYEPIDIYNPSVDRTVNTGASASICFAQDPSRNAGTTVEQQ